MLSTRSLSRLSSRLPPRPSPLLSFSSSSPPSSRVGTEIPISYMHGEPSPTVQPRSEYPSWLWNITSSKTLSQLDKFKDDKGFDGMELEEQKRYVKLEGRRAIKESNEDSTT
ncbi:hypothetical protein TrST_g12345 [Triparma strigata]|uniref:Ribosomal protein L37 n=1 Tax=Triparma strigata TaxID=1606541 RepID=A0A9W7ADV1_9STRA|nr:hypothetical protein TrST_g12345 [Triparma strigata]